jgi:Raf kinase inhibitor-like YbhB/YbcL family protein
MALAGRLLKNKRAGQEGMAWNAQNLAGPDTLELSSPDFGHEAAIPVIHASKRIGGQDVSPALTWSAVPAGTAELLLVVEDPDAPMKVPNVHCVALLDPSLTSLPQGALDAAKPAPGVRIMPSDTGSGYRGPAPVKGHGPHRYVFQLFALGKPVTAAQDARPRGLLASAGDVLARGRHDGFYERT